jgi:MoaA/NifB/PqqE/SkfB family radical SAM enzyme
VTNDGNVSLSRRWADAGLYFGTNEDSSAAIHSSELFQRICEIAADAATKTQCCGCLVLDFCSGFLRAMNPDHDCSPFLAMHRFMGTHSQPLQEYLSSLPAGKTRELFEALSGAPPPAGTNAGVRAGCEQRPETAVVFVSDRCLNNCIFCAPALMRKEGKALSDEAIQQFISQSASQGVRTLVFSGAGEPVLNPMIPDFVHLAKIKGIERTIITTSGAGLTKEMLERLEKSGNDVLVFSLHGIAGTHDAIVGRGGAFSELREAMDLAKKTSMQVRLNTCLVRSNLTQLLEIIALGREYCALEHNLSFPERSGNALDHGALLPSYREAQEALCALPWDELEHVVLDNMPRCLAPAGARCINAPGRIKYKDLKQSRIMQAALNFGNNIIPEPCQRARCRWLDICPGIDKAYVRMHGLPEVLPQAGLPGEQVSP